jgi:hypothetical protein
MKRIGEDVSEKFDYVPGVFTVHRHVRGKWAAAIMSLIQSAKLNGHDPHAYLKDVMERLPTQRTNKIGELLPNRWGIQLP